MSKTYLGDGAYAEFVNPVSLCLTTEDGVDVTNIIYLEPEVLSALLRYVGATLVPAKVVPSEVARTRSGPVAALDAWRIANEKKGDSPDFWRGFHYAREVLVVETSAEARVVWTCARGHANTGGLECATCSHPYAQIPSDEPSGVERT